MESIRIVDVDAETIFETGVCGYKDKNRLGFLDKVNWLNNRFKEGLRLKAIVTEQDGTQGMIEYLPGELCWRPVDAGGYLFIHCLFVGFKKSYKNRGFASQLIKTCLSDARHNGKLGVAVVTRKGAFMAGKDIFLKHGFHVVDKAPSDFELLAHKFDPQSPPPHFKDNSEHLKQFAEGLTIIRANQCPYTVKNVLEISETAIQTFGLVPRIVNLKSAEQAQRVPHAFGTFCILYDGKIIAEHPISNTRFINIMKTMKH